MNKILLTLFIGSSILAHGESAEYPWRNFNEDSQDWVSIYDNLPECERVVFAMDDKDNIWVGKWNDQGIFCPIVVGQEWPMPEVKITHWSYICTISR